MQCPHSIYFFRDNTGHFEFINNYDGKKTAEELTAHPNPLLVPENEGKYYKSLDEFYTTVDYVEGAGEKVNVGDYIIIERVTTYSAVTPAAGDNPMDEGWYERSGPAGNYTYTLTTDTTVVSGKTYYEIHYKIMFDDFGDAVTNTFRDWGIVPLGRPVIAPPQQKINQIDIPGANGILDLSNSLTKYPVFNNRTGTLKFAVYGDVRDTPTTYTKMMRFLQGTNVKMILEDDEEYFYEGRVFVESIDAKYDGTWTEISVGYDLDPYRKSIHTSIDDWLWDPFNFETDVVQDTTFDAIQITASTSTAWNDVPIFDFSGLIDMMPVCPEFTVDTINGQPLQAQLYNSDLGINWKTFSIPEGTTKFYDLIFCEFTPQSQVKMRFRNPGQLTIKFRSGRL